MAPRSARRPPPNRKRRSLFSRLRRRVFAGAPGPTKEGGQPPPPNEGGDFGGVREPRRPKRSPSGAAAVRELPRDQFLDLTTVAR